MRFMMIVKGSPDSEAGVMPDETLLGAMMRYNQELANAGVLVDLAGLQPTAKGARVRFRGGKATVVDGPFPGNPRDVIAGYWLIQVKSRDEAIEWAKRIPAPHGAGQEGEIELRQLFELDDFAAGPAIDHARELQRGLLGKRNAEGSTAGGQSNDNSRGGRA
jgi:hypothetical protein